MAESTSTTEPATLTVRVLFFSVLREKVGARELEVTLGPSATGNDLLDHLAKGYPAVAEHTGALRLAVNQTYAPHEIELSDGDDVALITPVSGG